MPIESPYVMQPIQVPLKDRLLDLQEVMDVTHLSRASVFRNPDLRALRIKVGFRTLWSEFAVQEMLAIWRKQASSELAAK